MNQTKRMNKNPINDLSCGKSLHSIQRYALCLLLAAPLGLQAQDSDDEAIELETLVVEGYADSLRQAMQAKRGTTEVTDSILSEDIGQFPDENVAEALQRITGVQIQRSNGEGTYISVRGVEPNLNLVTIDGRTASSGGFERAFDFSTLSANLVSSLKVVKSQSADMVEGGIGAVVEIETPKPLNFKDERVGRLTATGSYVDMTGNWSQKYSGLFSQQFDEGRQGILFSFSHEDVEQRTDNFGNNGWVRNAVAGGQDRFIPRFFLAQAYQQDRKRVGFTSAYQFKPSDTLKFTLSGNVNRYDTEQERNAYNVDPPDTQRTAGLTPEEVLASYTYNENGTAISYNGGPVVGAVPIQQYGLRQTWVTGFGANMEWSPSDRLDIEVDVSMSDSYNDSNPENRVDIRWTAAGAPQYAYTLPEGGGVPDVELLALDPTDNALFNVRQLNMNRAITENEDKAIKVDLDYAFENGFFTSFETGIRSSDKTTAVPRRFDHPTTRPANFPIGIPTPDSVTVPFPVSDFLTGTGADVIREWMVVDQEATLDYLITQGLGFDMTDPWSTARQDRLFRVEEEVLAGYAKLNFATQLGELPISGNFGVRYADTTVNSSGAQNIGGVIEQVTLNNSYDDLLPSFTIVAKPHKDLIVRLAGSSVMTRPNLGFMQVNQSVNLERVPVSINNGNPFLDPYRADTLDLSFEWYINDIDSLSLAFFKKDVESYVSRTSSSVSFTDAIAPGAGIAEGEEVLITRPENLDGDTIEGFEVSYQTQFAKLPAPFDGLGFTANYTYTKSGLGIRNFVFADADLRLPDGSFPEDALAKLPLPGNSKHSYNYGVFYDKGPFSMRLAYNWRENYLINPQFHQNAPLMRDDYGQWDGRIQYTINEHLKVTFDAINIGEESTYEYYAQEVSSPNPDSRERIRLLSQTGKKYNLGMTYSF